MGNGRISVFKGIVAGLAVALSSAVMANAATTFSDGVTYSIAPQNSRNVFSDATGHNALYKSTSYRASGHSEYNVGAGVFRLQATDVATHAVQDFLAFCLSPTTYLHLPGDYTKSATLNLSTTALGQLGALVANAWGTWDAPMGGANYAAAFQIAAWEIVTENGAASTLSLNGYNSSTRGQFYLTSGLTSTYGNIATGWLNDLNSGNWALTTTGFTLLQPKGTSQNLLTIAPTAPVPLPATGLLLLAGVGLMFGAGRKMRKAA